MVLPRDVLERSDASIEVERLSGGNSRATFELTIEGPDPRRYIAQVPMVADGSTECERRWIEAARAAGVPVAGVVFGGAGTRLSERVLVFEAIEGLTSPSRLVNDLSYESALAQLPSQIGTVMARLHGMPPPPGSGGAGPADPLERLADRYQRQGANRPAVSAGLRVLQLTPVPRRGPCAVHGDLRFGNLIVDTEGLAAVIDWEVAHVGEPGEDIGWLLSPTWRLGGLGPFDDPMDVATLLDAYAATAGWRPSRRELSWWQLYAVCLWAVAAMELTARSRSSARPNPEQVAAGRALLPAEQSILRLAEEVLDG